MKSDSTNSNLKIQPEVEHISEDQIDAFVLQSFLVGRNDSSIEQHLIGCHICRARMEESWDFIQSLRQTIHKMAPSRNPQDHGTFVYYPQKAPL